MKFLTKSVDFFEIFDKVAANISQASTLLVALMENFKTLDAWGKEIYELDTIRLLW